MVKRRDVKTGAGGAMKWLQALCLLLMGAIAAAQQGDGLILDQAHEHYSEGMFAEAVEGYTSWLRKNPSDMKVMYMLAKSYMHMDRPDQAHLIFSTMDGLDKKIPEEWYLTMGRAAQENSSFKEAERFYRLFIEHANKKTDLSEVRFLMLQTGEGVRFTPGLTTQYVENMGSFINGTTDEYGPVYSPNFDQKIYYTVRRRSEDFSHSGEWVENQDLWVHEMRSAEIRQGRWQNTGPMDEALAGSQSQVLLDFIDQGQRVLFEKQEFTGITKTFSHMSGSEDRVIPPVWYHPFYRSEKGDRDLTMINDSAFLFSSERYKGYGGYDIYVTYKRLGMWVMENLGPRINSTADEITPFLAADGRTLYFSSNSEKSMGGYDVFYSVFDDGSLEWTRSENAGRPVNSGKDETGFRLSASGNMGVFASDRPGGYGGYDLYQVFMDQPMAGNPERPIAAFYEVGNFQEFIGSALPLKEPEEVKPTQIIPSVYFSRSPVMVNKEIKATLDQILHYTTLYPHIRLVFHIFTEEKGVNGFSLFRPYLLLEPAVRYLKENGLASSRMAWWIYRNQDFLQPLSGEGEVSSAGKMNRVEFELADSDNLPVRFELDSGEAAEFRQRNDFYRRWLKQKEGVYFSVRLLKSEHLLQGDGLRDESDVMMEVFGPEASYSYYSGMYATMEESRKNLSRIKAKGFENAEIAAFYKGRLLDADQISAAVIEAYPELKEYIIYQQ